MTKKNIIIFSLIVVSLVGLILLTGYTKQTEKEISKQPAKEPEAEVVGIDLNEARRAAEEYLELEKKKDYEGLLSMFYRLPDYDQSKIEEEHRIFIEIMKIYNEELGDIVEYSYKSYEWQSVRHWTSGKTEPASLTLIYEVEYTKHAVDRTITIVKEGDKLKVEKFGMRGPLSWEIQQKIMESLRK